MIRLAAAALVMLLTGGQDSPVPVPGPVPLEHTMLQVTVHQRVIIRIPRGEPRVPASAGAVSWRESSGPRCISARQIAGAIPTSETVDLVMRDNRRFRARLAARCGGLDYYRGLYVNAQSDGMICAERDVIRSRMGGECAIARFQQLQPVRR